MTPEQQIREATSAIREGWCNGCKKPPREWGPVCGGMTTGDMTHFHSSEWWASRLHVAADRLVAERDKLQGRVYALETSLPENFLASFREAETQAAALREKHTRLRNAALRVVSLDEIERVGVDAPDDDAFAWGKAMRELKAASAALAAAVPDDPVEFRG